MQRAAVTARDPHDQRDARADGDLCRRASCEAARLVCDRGEAAVRRSRPHGDTYDLAAVYHDGVVAPPRVRDDARGLRITDDVLDERAVCEAPDQLRAPEDEEPLAAGELVHDRVAGGWHGVEQLARFVRGPVGADPDEFADDCHGTSPQYPCTKPAQRSFCTNSSGNSVFVGS